MSALSLRKGRFLRCRGIVAAIGMTIMTESGRTAEAPTEDGVWYYRIGGAEPISAPANPNIVTLTIGGSADLRLGSSCGKFDPVLAVRHTLNDIAGGVDSMVAAMTAAATNAIGSPPGRPLRGSGRRQRHARRGTEPSLSFQP